MHQLWALGSGAWIQRKDQGRAMVHSPFGMFYRVWTAVNTPPIGGFGRDGRGRA